MALLFLEGFDHYSLDADLEARGWLSTGFHTISIGSAYRRGTTGMGLLTGNVYYFKRQLRINYTTIYAGFAFIQVEAGDATAHTSYPLFYVTDENNVIQIKLILTSTYEIKAYDGGNALLGTSASYVIPNDLVTWCYMEVKITISDTVGEVIVRINEVEVLNLTLQDTKYGTDYIRKVGYRGVYNRTTYFDDLYIDDSQFHGNCQVRTFMPDSDGTHSDFVRSTGSNDFECVDEIPPNVDTDYIKASVVGDKSTFGITTGVLGTVKAIQLSNHTRVINAGTRKIKPLIRSNGVDYNGEESEVAFQSAYQSIMGCWDTDPDDSAPWTQAKLEAAEFGLEITV